MFYQANDYKKPSSSQPGVGAGSASQLQNAGVGAGSVRQLKNAGVGDGSVSQLKNARVDVRFASGRLPPIMTVLKVPGNSTFLVVSQHLNANIVRTIAHGGTEELGRGQMVINTGHPITGDYSNLDWRKILGDLARKVKDQGKCSTCWAYTILGLLQYYYAMSNGTTINLSVQQLITWNYVTHGRYKYRKARYEGDPEWALVYIAKSGLMLERDFPYKGRANPKIYFEKMSSMKTCFKLTSFTHLHQAGDKKLSELLTRGPFMAMILAAALEPWEMTKFGPRNRLYRNGEVIMSKNVLFLESDHYFYRPRKYDPENRHMENNHVVLVVAEDVVQGIPVWEVVNTWGKEWGASGHFYLEKGAFGINKNVWVPDFTTFRLVGPGKDA